MDEKGPKVVLVRELDFSRLGQTKENGIQRCVVSQTPAGEM